MSLLISPINAKIKYGVSPSLLSSRRKKGVLTAFPVGRKFYYLEKEVEALPSKPAGEGITEHHLNSEAAAEFLGIPFTTLASLCRDGKGPVRTKSGLRWFYHPQDLEAWILANAK